MSINATRATKENPSAQFKIGSPFEGNTISVWEYYETTKKSEYEQSDLHSREEILEAEKSIRELYEEFDKDYHRSRTIAVRPTKGIAKAPFDGTVFIDSTLGAVFICADNGVTVNISVVSCVHSYRYFNNKTKWHVDNGSVVKKGDLLFKFNKKELPPNSPAVVQIYDIDGLGGYSDEQLNLNYGNIIFTLLDKTKVSFGDTIIEVEGEPLKCEDVEKIIHELKWLKYNLNMQRIKMDMESGMFSGVAMLIMPPE